MRAVTLQPGNPGSLRLDDLPARPRREAYEKRPGDIKTVLLFEEGWP